jgi:hypothetical protein
MKNVKQLLVPVILLALSINSYSQQDGLLTSLPTTKEEFAKSEKAVINTINWLENTPVNQDIDKRKKTNALVIAWITNSPTVTIEINMNTLPFTKKNTELLMSFMGGWTKYCLENSYSEDKIKGNLAGIKSAIKVYKMGNGLKSDKSMDKLIALDEKGELEKWIKDQLEKK